MFSSLFGSSSRSPDEIEISQRPPYLAQPTPQLKEAYMKAALKELQILRKSQISLQIEDVPIQMPGHITKLFIHTLKGRNIHQTQQQSNQTPKTAVLMLHGFGGTSLSFMWTMGSLGNKLETYAIDFLGMGLSSRPQFHYNNQEDIEMFFATSIENWRVEKGISKLILVGHSFGGYMAFIYAKRYPSKVERLFLVSPMGGTKRTAEEVEAWVQTRKKEDGFLKRQLFSYVEGAWKDKKTLAQVFRSPLIPTSFLLGSYIKKRLKVPEQIQEDWQQYIEALFEFPDSSEKSVYYLLRFPRMSAIVSIEETINAEVQKNNKPFSFPIHYLYGDQDWMCAEGANRIVNSAVTHATFATMVNASHQIVFDQPKQLAEYVVDISIVKNQPQQQQNQDQKLQFNGI